MYMLNHISNYLLRFGNLGLSDTSSFDHFKYALEKSVTMISTTNITSMKEAVKVINASEEDETWRYENILNNWPARLARYSFRLSFARVQIHLHESLARLTLEARASIFRCVLERFRCVFDSTRNMAFLANIIPTVVRLVEFMVGQILALRTTMLSENQFW